MRFAEWLKRIVLRAINAYRQVWTGNRYRARARPLFYAAPSRRRPISVSAGREFPRFCAHRYGC